MIPGFNCIVMGPTGRGKTTSIRTLPHAGLQTFVLFTEPGMDKIVDLHGWAHWAYVPPHIEGWDVHLSRARTLQSMTWDSLAKQGDDPHRARYDAWIRLYPVFANFTCVECGEQFGDVTTWGPDRVLVVDGLSGINQASLDFCKGGAVGDEYGRRRGVAADQVYSLCGQTLAFLNCHYVLIAHARQSFFEDQRMVKTSVDILGKATVSSWARAFQDILVADYDQSGYYWSNLLPDADVKAGYLSPSPRLEQSFVPLVEAWRARAGVAPQAPQT